MTNKDFLSQEEIDALLRQSSELSDPDSSFDGLSGSAPSLNDQLSEMERDALGEIGNITFGSAATALSTLLGRKVEITTPKVSVITKSQLSDEYPRPHVAIHVNYVDGFQGTNVLVIKTRDAQIIADLMLGGDGKPNEGEEMNEIHISAVQEAMNQMMGSSATSMSTIFNRMVNISPPGIDILDFQKDSVSQLIADEAIIQIKFRLSIGDLIDSNIMQMLPVPFGKELVATLLGSADATSIPVDSKQAKSEPKASSAAVSQPVYASQMQIPEPAAQTGNGRNYGHEQAAPGYDYPPNPYQLPNQNPYYQQSPYHSQLPNPYQQAGPNQPQHPYYPPGEYPPPAAYQQPQGSGRGTPPRNIQQAQFSDLLGGGAAVPEAPNLGMLLDIPLKVTVELGRTQRLIKDILELSQGSIIELDKLAGEPVDILVNNKLIAKGEVVVIDENFGVRVTDIVSQWDRIQKLQ